MEKTLNLIVRSNYGTTAYYLRDTQPADCHAILTGAKTVAKRHMQAYIQLGFTLVIHKDGQSIHLTTVQQLSILV